MNTMNKLSFDLETNEPIEAPHIDTPLSDHSLAWEEVAEGRFRPRRIRGSCVGRELG